MYNRMLVPLDGSEMAEVVFPYVKEIASRLGTEVVLLHISSQAVKDFQPMIRNYVDHAAEKIQNCAIVSQQGRPSQPVKIHGEFVTGYPAEEILRYAEEKTVDLILMASHGRSGLKRWSVGSVADKILRSAKIPVLLVPAGIPGQVPFDQWTSRSLLVPLDGSELAESVFPHVETLAGIGNAQVVFLRVCEPPAMPTYYSPELSEIPLHWGQYAQQETARCKEVALKYMTNVENRFKKANITVHSEILVGKAADEMINYANKAPFGLIVMATHGRSGLSRLVYGSVAASILVGVSNPILLIKPTKQ
jgi:nucleotide-binding universal stress UspA family protein